MANQSGKCLTERDRIEKRFRYREERQLSTLVRINSCFMGHNS